jgi:cysteinyl-tRNA synthetase
LDHVDAALADNLNIADLLGEIFQWIRETNKAMDTGKLNAADSSVFDDVWTQIDAVLGLGEATVAIPSEVQALLDQRAEARKAKNFAKSDELRKAIEALGWKVKDTSKGQELLPG